MTVRPHEEPSDAAEPAEPVADAAEPAAESAEPTALSDAERANPVADAASPAAESAEPAADALSDAESAEPVADALPAVDSAEPVADALPAADSAEPTADTVSPAADAASPIADTAEPVADIVSPAAAIASPIADAATPASASAPPASASPGHPVAGIVLRGVKGLFRASCPTVCPTCDAPLSPALAKEPSPRCPACDQPLVPMRVAGLWLRAAAGLLDGVVLLLTAGLLNLLLLSWLDPPPLLEGARGLPALLRVLELDPAAVLRRIAPALVMGALYLGLFWSLTGQTLGHRVLRLRVVDPWGRPPRPWRAAVRVLGHGLGLAIGAMGWLWVAFDREKRGLHDHLARTYVVRES